MARLCRAGLQILTKSFASISISNTISKPQINIGSIARSFSVTPLNLVKELREVKEDGNIIIEGEYVASPREGQVVKAPEKLVDGKPVCYMCALDLDLKFTDVLILNQFLRSDGCMLPRRITGLCKMQQKRITKLVAMAQKAGLMINITPDYCKKDPTRRYKYKKFNTYFDEKTLFMRRRPKQWDKFKRR